MPKYYKKKYYRGGKDKYSVEHRGGSISVPTYPTQQVTTIVPPSTLEGTRKVKHLGITLSSNVTDITGMYWALVYVPEGYTANSLSVTAGSSIYEPNQNVMACGVLNFSAGPARIYSKLSRNLSSGDHIDLILLSTGPAAIVATVVDYAITLQ